MPEGHAVHRIARTLWGLFGDEALAVSSPQGRFEAGAALLTGRVLAVSEAHGKQLFLGFDRDGSADATSWLRVHLGLYGAWTFQGDSSATVAHAMGAPRRRIAERDSVLPNRTPAEGTGQDAWRPLPPQGAVRVRLVGTHAAADLTGPSACEVLTPDEKAAVQARLGPDPLREDGDSVEFVRRARRSRTPIAQLLMEQSVIAGAGNIYRAESLFRARLAPMTPGNAVPEATLHEIWDDLVVLMADGVARGRIVTTGDVEDPYWVYQRDGAGCRVCDESVRVTRLAGRNLFWCPSCQS